MARTPAYWTNKKCRPSVQAVSQLSLSQPSHGFGAPYRGFPAFLSPSNCLNRQAGQATQLVMEAISYKLVMEAISTAGHGNLMRGFMRPSAQRGRTGIDDVWLDVL